MEGQARTTFGPPRHTSWIRNPFRYEGEQFFRRILVEEARAGGGYGDDAGSGVVE